MDVFSQRIADKIAENCIGGRAVLATVDNRRLSLILESHALIVQQSAGAASSTDRGMKMIIEMLLGSGLLRNGLNYIFLYFKSRYRN